MNCHVAEPASVSTISASAQPALPALLPPAAAWRAANGARPRILYVDDESQLRTLAEMVLGGSGYDVETAADGGEAWNALLEANYHLLVTDNDMPRLTGLELARKARLAGMRLPIVLASGSSDALRNPANSWLGLAACLPKPFAATTLLETVGQVLRIANGRGQSAVGTSSVLAQMARVRPYPHGGINE